MSRIGQRVLTVPSNVTVEVNGTNVNVKGPKGELSIKVHKDIKVNVSEGHIIVTRENEEAKCFHGTANANINNAIIGVTKGFEKKLEAVGVGYRFAVKGNELVITAGFSHPVKIKVPKNIQLESPSNTELFIRGNSKEEIGKFAAELRSIREPEPYKGKGIRYAGEVIRHKEGKKAA